MRLNQILLLLALFSLLSGCSDRLYWLTMTPDKQVLDGYDEDQALRDHVAKLAKGPTVKGSACTWFTMGQSMMIRTRHSAYANTMGKAGPPFDTLIDVVQTSTSYPPLPLYCVSLEGTPVRSKTQHSALDSSTPSTKSKGKSR